MEGLINIGLMLCYLILCSTSYIQIWFSDNIYKLLLLSVTNLMLEMTTNIIISGCR